MSFSRFQPLPIVCTLSTCLQAKLAQEIADVGHPFGEDFEQLHMPAAMRPSPRETAAAVRRAVGKGHCADLTSDSLGVRSRVRRRGFRAFKRRLAARARGGANASRGRLLRSAFANGRERPLVRVRPPSAEVRGRLLAAIPFAKSHSVDHTSDIDGV